MYVCEWNFFPGIWYWCGRYLISTSRRNLLHFDSGTGFIRRKVWWISKNGLHGGRIPPCQFLRELMECYLRRFPFLPLRNGLLVFPIFSIERKLDGLFGTFCVRVFLWIENKYDLQITPGNWNIRVCQSYLVRIPFNLEGLYLWGQLNAHFTPLSDTILYVKV